MIINNKFHGVVLAMVLILSGLSNMAYAVEGGKSMYLLGKRGPLAGLIPKPGVYITNDLFYYSGDTDQELPIAGIRANNVSVDAVVNVLQATAITEEVFENGRLALSAVLPYGRVEIDADATASAYGSPVFAVGAYDDLTAFGDLALAASLGWRHRDGDLFRAWSIYSTVFAPTGSYEEGRLANMSANRWGLDIGTGFTMGNFKKGREFSGVFGVTFNGDNNDTDYNSGNEALLELAYKQHLPSGFAAGIVAYTSHQFTNDKGGPDVLGGFKGRVSGIGPELSYQFEAAGRTMGLDLRWYHEFDAKNRVEGDSAFLTLSLPL